jgi:hypothetical protein
MVTGCTIEFSPDSDENSEQLVVEGMITDQNRVNKIKPRDPVHRKSLLKRKAVNGAIVTITDEEGNIATLTESPSGTYSTDSQNSEDALGSYSLNVKINEGTMRQIL